MRPGPALPADGVPAYDVVWSYLVPLAIPLLLLRADLRLDLASRMLRRMSAAN